MPTPTAAYSSAGSRSEAVCRRVAAVSTSMGSTRTNCGTPARAITTWVVWSPTLTVATVSSGRASAAVTRARPNAVRSTAWARTLTFERVEMICSMFSETAATSRPET